MTEQPSYRKSTLSLVFLGANVFYAFFAIITAAGVIWTKLSIETAKELMVWPTVLWSNINTSYFTARQMGKTNGNESSEASKP